MNIDSVKGLETKSEKVGNMRKEAFKEIKSNKDFYDSLIAQGLNDEMIFEYVGSLLSLLHERQTCANCPGIKKCPLEPEHFVRNLVLQHDFINYEIGYCKKYSEILSFRNLILVDDLNPNFAEKKLNEIEIDNIRIDLLKKIYVYNNKKLDENNLIFIVGEPGSGVSFITDVFFSNYLKTYKNYGIYADAMTRISELNDLCFKNKYEFNEKLEEYKNVDVLVLNKISSAYINDFIRDNILFPIINSRFRSNKLTIITSEISLFDFIKVIGGKTELGKIKAKQIYDMLKKFDQFNITQKIKLYR